jgi:hypothetical protein
VSHVNFDFSSGHTGAQRRKSWEEIFTLSSDPMQWQGIVNRIEPKWACHRRDRCAAVAACTPACSASCAMGDIGFYLTRHGADRFGRIAFGVPTFKSKIARLQYGISRAKNQRISPHENYGEGGI